MNISASAGTWRPNAVHYKSQNLEPVTYRCEEAGDGFQTSSDDYWMMAAEKMREAHIELANHSLMRENLATYLAHSTRSIPSARWENKISRELSHPYTDKEVYQHLDELEDSVQANLQEFTKMPGKVYITGSFAKGRLGANSDLDGFAVIPPEEMKEGFDSFERREANPTGSNLFPLSADSPGYTKGHLMFAGQSVEFTPEELMTDGLMRKTYDKLVEARTIDRIETSQTFEWATNKLWGEDKSAKQKREAFESNSMRTRIQNGIMSLGGTLSETPIVGVAVNATADLFAAQKHVKAKDLLAQSAP